MVLHDYLAQNYVNSIINKLEGLQIVKGKVEQNN